MKKHTNLPNEITGAYYEEKDTLAIDLIFYGVFIGIFLLIDWFFPEVVTEVLSKIVMLVK